MILKIVQNKIIILWGEIMENIPKYIDTSGKHLIENVTWILQEKESNDKRVVYYGYDANLFPCTNYSTWKETEFKERQKSVALSVLKDVNREVWLDDVRVK